MKGTSGETPAYGVEGVDPVSTSLPLFVRATAPPDDPETPTFLLLHGYGGSSYTWRHWVDPLRRRGRVVLVDLKGFGRAPKPDGDDYGPGDQAEHVVALIAELGLRRVTLVGHSLGGGISLMVADAMADHPAKPIRRLVLVSAAAYRQRLPPFATLARAPRLSAGMLRLLGTRRVVRWVLRSVVYDPACVDGGQVDAYAEPLLSPGGLRAPLATGRNLVPDDLDQLVTGYPSINLPTLLLWGDHDRVVPLWVGQRLADDLPRARLVVLDRCGHLPPEERPAASWAAMSAFLEETAGVAPEAAWEP